MWFGGIFGARPIIFPPFMQAWNLGFMKQFATFLIDPLPDLLNNGFTIIDTGLFYGGEHLWAKICIFLTFFDKITSYNDDFWSGTTTTCENTSNPNVLLKHWAYFPKDMLINSKTRYIYNLLNFYNNLILV